MSPLKRKRDSSGAFAGPAELGQRRPSKITPDIGDGAPLSRSILSSQVSEVIMKGLLEGRLRPGDRLVENDLVALLGVSRSPIREALSDLAQSGVVVREPGRGCRIRVWHKRDLEELFGLRSVLEGYAARLAVDRFEADAQRTFEKVITEMQRAGDREDFVGMIELDLRFHELVWKLAGSTLLLQVLQGLSQQFRLFLTLNWKFHGGIRNVAGNHRRLLEALASGSSERADEEMNRHVVVEKMVTSLVKYEGRDSQSDDTTIEHAANVHQGVQR